MAAHTNKCFFDGNKMQMFYNVRSIVVGEYN